LIPDLAESYEMSEDGRSYTFTLKENAFFHDGTRVTSDDVVFTMQRAQDPMIKSVKRANWEGVAVEKINERQVKFTLKQPYAPFIENATIGILPKHLWKNIGTEGFQFSTLNSNPIGAGPYKIEKIDESASRVPTAYTLSPFKEYALGTPYISKIVLQFYGNETSLINAFANGNIESMGGISPSAANILEAGKNIAKRVPLPRIFGIFFNQNKSKILTEKPVREALGVSINKEELVKSVLLGYGSAIYGPLPPHAAKTFTEPKTDENLRAEAEQILEKGKWKKNKETGIFEKQVGKETEKLSIKLSTAAVPELRSAAEFVATEWRALGAEVELRFFDASDLSQTVIRPREYEALLFGEIVGRDLDLFAFWHSSQRNDPGLNIALYTNIKADRLLEEARTTGDKQKRDAALAGFAEEIRKDVPAVFLYAPDFIYFLPDKVKDLPLGKLALPNERWSNIYKAYINTEKVLPIFIH
jgi:peptide/nickel transport system substrate-binding protein